MTQLITADPMVGTAERRQRPRSPDFPEQFRVHVLPHLTAMIPHAAARLIADDCETYTTLYHELWWHAWRHGAAFLTDRLQHELSDWLHTHLLEEIERQADVQTLVERVVQDIATHDAHMMEALGDAELLG